MVFALQCNGHARRDPLLQKHEISYKKEIVSLTAQHSNPNNQGYAHKPQQMDQPLSQFPINWVIGLIQDLLYIAKAMSFLFVGCP